MEKQTGFSDLIKQSTPKFNLAGGQKTSNHLILAGGQKSTHFPGGMDKRLYPSLPSTKKRFCAGRHPRHESKVAQTTYHGSLFLRVILVDER